MEDQNVQNTVEGKVEQKLSDGVSKGTVVVMLILTALVFTGVGMGGYWLFSKGEQESDPSTSSGRGEDCTYEGETYEDGDRFEASDGCNSCECLNGEVACTEMECSEDQDEDTADGSEDAEEEAYEGWETYENKKKGIGFKYPNSWEIEETLDNPLGFTITAADGQDYSINFYAWDDSYPYYCIYSDTDTSSIREDMIGIDRTFDSYVEVKDDDLVYRRGKYNFGDDSYELTVCKKQSDGTYQTGEIYIGYNVPEVTSEEKMEVLDMILLSYQIDD